MTSSKTLLYNFSDKNIVVHRCIVNNRISVEIVDLDSYIGITFATLFKLRLNDCLHTVDPESNVNVKLVLDLLGCRLNTISVSPDNVLQVDFHGGAQVIVHPDVNYESWSVTFGDPRVYLVGWPTSG